MENVVDYMTNVCSVEEELIIPLMLDRVHKHLFYLVTREGFIKEALRDWSEGKKVTEEQLEKRKKLMMQHDNIFNGNLDTYLTVKDKVQKLAAPPVPIAAYAALSDLKEAVQKESADAARQIMEQFGDIIKVDDQSDKNYYCTICKLTFRTSLASMARHARAHGSGLPTKIWHARGSGVFRPDQHVWNYNTEKYYGGSDTTLHEVVGVEQFLKPSAENPERKVIHCPHCDKYIRPYNSEASISARGRNVSFLLEHVKTCVVATRDSSAEIPDRDRSDINSGEQ